MSAPKKVQIHLRDEEQGLLGGESPSIQTPEDNELEENPAVLETAGKRDIALMIFINFLSFVCFAIVLPSLWPFLKTVSNKNPAVHSGRSLPSSVRGGQIVGWLGCGREQRRHLPRLAITGEMDRLARGEGSPLYLPHCDDFWQRDVRHV